MTKEEFKVHDFAVYLCRFVDIWLCVWQVIDVSKSVVNMMASKVEVVMKKAEPITWARLDTPPPKPQPTNEKKENQDQEKMTAW